MNLNFHFLAEHWLLITAVLLLMLTVVKPMQIVHLQRITSRILLQAISIILFFNFFNYNLNFNFPLFEYQKASLYFDETNIEDFYTQTIKLFFLTLLWVWLQYGAKQYKKTWTHPEVFPLVLFLAYILCSMISAFNLFIFYLYLEALNLVLYAFLVPQQKIASSSEAIIKYFCFNALSSSLFLFGMAIVYEWVGGLDYLSIHNMTTLSLSLFYGFFFILISFLIKLSLVPTHLWTADVYEGSNTWITTLLAVFVKGVLFCILLRLILYTFVSFKVLWKITFLVSGLLSVIIGTFGTLSQKTLKRFFAYSTIQNIGLVFIGLATYDTYNISGIASSVLYFFIYLLSVFGFFLVYLDANKTFQEGKDRTNVLFFSEFWYYGRSTRATWVIRTVLLNVFILTIAGFPPFVSFYAKFLLFLDIFAEYQIIGCFLLATLLVTTFYYIRILKSFYFEDPKLSLFVQYNKSANFNNTFIATDSASLAKGILVLVIIVNLFNLTFFHVSMLFIKNLVLAAINPTSFSLVNSVLWI